MMRASGRYAPVSALLAATIAISGCATSNTEEADTDYSRQTMELIREMQLETVPAIRVTHGELRIYQANRRFATARVGNDFYLFETERECPSLAQPYDKSYMGDYRTSGGWVRAGIDTIRDCRISAIYLLPQDSAETTAEESGPINSQEPE